MLQSIIARTASAAIALSLFCSSATYAEVASMEAKEVLKNIAVDIKAHPKEVKLYLMRALVYEEIGELEKSIADLNLAVLLEPKNPEPYNRRGNFFANRSNFDEALKDFGKAISLDPNYSRPYVNRGFVYTKLGKFDLSLVDFNRAVNLEPKFGKAFYNRGCAYFELKRYDEAMQDMKSALSLDRKLTLPVLEQVGDIYLAQGKFDDAISSYSDFLKMGPQVGRIFFKRGKAFERNGKSVEAERDKAAAQKYGYRGEKEAS